MSVFTGPADHAIAVTPSDTVPLTVTSRGIYVGATGNLTVDMADGTTGVLFVAVPAGTLLPIRVTKVKSTGTNAASLVALW